MEHTRFRMRDDELAYSREFHGPIVMLHQSLRKAMLVSFKPRPSRYPI